jgi:hypothetical protein
MEASFEYQSNAITFVTYISYFVVPINGTKPQNINHHLHAFILMYKALTKV